MSRPVRGGNMSDVGSVGNAFAGQMVVSPGNLHPAPLALTGSFVLNSSLSSISAGKNIFHVSVYFVPDWVPTFASEGYEL